MPKRWSSCRLLTSLLRAALWTIAWFGFAQVGFTQQPHRSYNLPAVELKERVLWGSVCEPAAGLGLKFGGEDQQADDGCAHTQVLRDDEWVDIHAELESVSPWHQATAILRGYDESSARLASRLRSEYLSHEVSRRGRNKAGEIAEWLVRLSEDLVQAAEIVEKITAELPKGSYFASQGIHATQLIGSAKVRIAAISRQKLEPVSRELLLAVHALRPQVQQAAAVLDCEPSPRALSPLCYDPKHKFYFLFGGDHLDYLTCDLWIFDPAMPEWRQLHPPQAPSPRANHKLVINEHGQLVLTGGYTYTSNTDYVGGQYRDLNDGTWTYDFATNRWIGQGELVQPGERTYRTGPFDPAYFWQGERPQRTTFLAQLASLPVNEWVKLDVPFRPEVNRDWGTAVLDPTHNLILRFSGGHSAHGGTDVPHFHLMTGRWEVPFAVEFPLGQLYSNTSYPEGFNFNRRPWVTGHTYKSYAYDVASERMLFVGERSYTYLYDPVRGDWTGERIKKPDGMNYGSCYYTLTLCPTPHGTFCWTNEGRLFHWEQASEGNREAWQWREVKLNGEKLPGSVVDRAGLAYDRRRERLLFTTKPYEGPFDGQVYAVDLNTWKVTQLDPPNRAAMTNVGFLREVVYVPELDAVLQGVNFPLEAGQPRLTPAFDCANQSWIALELAGADPSGETGVNVSLGLMYDAARKLVWAVDTQSHVYVLRLDAKSLVKHPVGAE